MIIWKHCLFTC